MFGGVHTRLGEFLPKVAGVFLREEPWMHSHSQKEGRAATEAETRGMVSQAEEGQGSQQPPGRGNRQGSILSWNHQSGKPASSLLWDVPLPELLEKQFLLL